jgi:hypothetical protein
VYSQEDFFEQRYQILKNLYQEMQSPDLFHKKDVLTIVNNAFMLEIPPQDKKGTKKLEETFLSKFPNSDTAKKISEKSKARLFTKLAFNG